MKHYHKDFIVIYKENNAFIFFSVEVFNNFANKLILVIKQGDQEFLINMNYCPICGVRGENIDEHRDSNKAE